MIHSSMTDFTSSTTVQVLTEAPRPTVSLTTSPENVHSVTLTTYLATTTSISCLPERVSESVQQNDVKASMNSHLPSMIHSSMSDFSSSTTVQMLTKPPTVSLTTSPESVHSVTPTTYLATSSIPCLHERDSESMCKRQQNDVKTFKPLILGASGILLVLTTVTIIVVLCLRRRRRQRAQEVVDMTSTELQDNSLYYTNREVSTDTNAVSYSNTCTGDGVTTSQEEYGAIDIAMYPNAAYKPTQSSGDNTLEYDYISQDALQPVNDYTTGKEDCCVYDYAR